MSQRTYSVGQLLVLFKKHRDKPWFIGEFGRLVLTDRILDCPLRLIAEFEGLAINKVTQENAGSKTYVARLGKLVNITPSLTHGVLMAVGMNDEHLRKLYPPTKVGHDEFTFTRSRVSKIRQLRKYILSVLGLKEIPNTYKEFRRLHVNKKIRVN